MGTREDEISAEWDKFRYLVRDAFGEMSELNATLLKPLDELTIEDIVELEEWIFEVHLDYGFDEDWEPNEYGLLVEELHVQAMKFYYWLNEGDWY